MANAAARTAYGPMAIVAIEQETPAPQRIVHDELAYHVLPPGTKVFARLGRLGPVRRLIVRALHKDAPGLWGSMLCRKRYLEDQLRDAVRTGIDAVVILGAGMDTLAHRLDVLGGLPVFEVDQPDNIALKRTLLAKARGGVPRSTTLVPVDFETQDLETELLRHGFAPGTKAFFAWEAVTQYLTGTGVRKTFDVLAKAAPGSRLVFTYIRQDFLDGTATYGAPRLRRQMVVTKKLWHFGMHPDAVADFLAGYGWRVLDQAAGKEFGERYLRPAGRDLEASEFEVSVHAEKS